MHAVMTGGFATVAGKFTDTQIFHVKKGFSCSPSVHGVCLCVKYKSKENWKKKNSFCCYTHGLRSKPISLLSTLCSLGTTLISNQVAPQGEPKLVPLL
jgi:hypothetical protein